MFPERDREDAVTSSCVPSPSATFTLSNVAKVSPNQTGGVSGSGNAGNGNNAVALVGDANALLGLVVMGTIGLFTAT